MQKPQHLGTIDKVLFRFFIFWYSVGVILLVFDILPPSLEWANSVFLIISGILGCFYFYRTYGNMGAVFSILVLFGSIGAESIGVKTGLIFGQYDYSSKLGVKLIGVPVAIGFAWVMILAVSHALAGSIIQPFHKKNSFRFLSYVATGAMIAVIMDGIIDPVAFLVKGYWFWDGNGIYYGIPFQNFVGWFLLASIFHGLLLLMLILNKQTKVSRHPYWHTRTIYVFCMVMTLFLLLGYTSGLYLASFIVTIACLIIFSTYYVSSKPIYSNTTTVFMSGKR